VTDEKNTYQYSYLTYSRKWFAKST
jgi:hypothetical protein